MKNINPTVEIPSVMNVNANAIWNKEKGVWEVSVTQINIGRSVLNNKSVYSQEMKTFEIAECDKFVIPWAILEMNGINIH